MIRFIGISLVLQSIITAHILNSFWTTSVWRIFMNNLSLISDWFLLLELSESESFVKTDGQSASLSWNKALIWGLWPDFYKCLTVESLLMWGALSVERTGLLYNCCWSSPGQSFSGPRDHILLSQIRDIPFRRLLRLAGLRWRYSTPPPHGINAQPFITATRPG
jgi:hypothetical protein